MQATSLIIGDTLNFTTAVADYPANSGWTLKYRLVPRVSGSAITLTGAADSSDPTLHRVQASAATTAAWAAGTYSWASWVEKASESYSIETGAVKLIADPRTSSAPLDLRSDAHVAYDQAKAALAAWTPTAKAYTIGGRRMEFNTPDEIIKVVNYWAGEVRREDDAQRLAAGMKTSRKVLVRLGRA